MQIRITLRPQEAEDTGVQSTCYSILYGNQEGVQHISLPGKFTKPSVVVPLTLWTSATPVQPDRGEERPDKSKEDER